MTVFLGLMLPLVVEVAKRLSVNPCPHVELSSTDAVGLIAVYSAAESWREDANKGGKNANK